MPRRLRASWTVAFAALGAAVAAQHLAALDRVPGGLYADEASIGYNAWAIAHHGVDEHGVSFPLYLEAFGEFKNPVYVYALAPLTRLLPLSAATERLPAALFGTLACLLAALCAWELTRSRGASLVTLAVAATMPWLVLESRVGFEVAAMTAALAAMLWCLARAERTGSGRWHAAAGATLGVSALAYSTGRLLGAALAVALLLVRLPYGGLRDWLLRRAPPPRRLSWLWFLAGPAAAYAAIGAFMLRHPGALTARFDLISVTSDTTSLWAALGRFWRNWADYLNAPFLLISGDANPRHHTGFGGMLLAATVPGVLAGVAVCLRRRWEPLCRFLLAGLLLAPMPAALTVESVPHALRSASMIPFLLGLSALGWAALLRRLRRPAVALPLALLAAGWAAQSAGYLADLYTAYPARASLAFDVQEGPTIGDAALAAGGRHAVLVSTSLDAAELQVLFRLTPAPGPSAAAALAPLGVRALDPAALGAAAAPGDLLVLAGGDPVPAGARPLFDRVTATPDGGLELIIVARR